MAPAFVIPLLIALALTACSSRGEDDVSASPTAGIGHGIEVDPHSKLGLPKLLGLEPKIQPETVVLDAEESPVDSATILNQDECAPGDPARVPCEFSLTFASAPQGITKGSVLASDVTDALPSGLLVKVTAVDGNTVLATEATLADALEQGEFLVEQEFTPSQVRSIELAPGVTATGDTALATASAGGMGTAVPGRAADLADVFLSEAQARRLVTGEGGGLAFNFDITDVELTEGVVANGHVGFDVGCGAYGGLTWETAWGIPIYPDGAYFEAKCGASQDGSLIVKADKKATLDESKEIARINLDPITFWVGPVPIVLIPTVVVTAKVSGQVEAQMTFGASEHFAAQAGITYNDGFHLIKEFSHGFDSTVSDVKARVTAKAGVQLGESLMLYGLAGPQLNEQIYAKFEGKPPGERPIWCLKGGIEASVELHVDLGIKDLNYGPEPLFSKEIDLGCAGNTAPTVAIQGGDQGLTVFPTSTSQPPVIIATSDDLEEGKRPITWAADGAPLGTSTSGQKFLLTALTPGTHTVTATVTDSDGGSATATTTVVAKDSTPTAQILVDKGSGAWTDSATASGTTGGEVLLQIQAKSPLGLVVASCMPTTWSGGLTVSSLNGCDYRVSLTKAGTFPLTATVTDPDGKTVTDVVTITVKDPAPGSPPSFAQISAVKTSVSPNVPLCDGCVMDWGDQVRLATTYTNSAQAAKSVKYVWEVQRKAGATTGAWTTLTGTDSSPASGSSRMFTAPTEYKNAYTYTFRVTVYDASTNVQYYQDTMVLTYAGPPA